MFGLFRAKLRPNSSCSDCEQTNLVAFKGAEGTCRSPKPIGFHWLTGIVIRLLWRYLAVMHLSLQESKAVEQEGEQALSESQESSDTQLENFQTSPDLTSTPAVKENAPAEPPAPGANTEPTESAPAIAATGGAATAPPQPLVVLPPVEPQSVNPDSQSRVYSLPDAYRGIGGDMCAGYGSLSRATLHGYWPAKNFQPGAHYTLPFLRDSYAPAALSGQAEEEGGGERGENPLDMKTDHPTASYPTLGGIHQFRPITTMELLREPSRTRYIRSNFIDPTEGKCVSGFQGLLWFLWCEWWRDKNRWVSTDRKSLIFQ